MSLRYFYRPDWRSNPSVEFTDNVQLYTFDTTENAEEGEAAMSSIVVNDEDGAFDFPALTRIWATETAIAASSNTYVFHGYIADRTVRRGDSERTSAARIWELSVVDENSILTRRILTSANSKRPQESDVARMQWLCNIADGQALIDDTTFLSTASPVTMDATDYKGQTGQDVMNDCLQQSGKNGYMYFKEGVGSAIWYGAETLSTHNSMVRLTNVLSEVDNNLTFAISEDTRLVRDPSRMASGVYEQYQNGAVYVRSQAMFPEIGMHDVSMSAGNVTTSARATARANRHLTELNSEEDRITTSVILPAAKVNWIKAGMMIPSFKATHLPQYEGGVALRVLQCKTSQLSEEYYLKELTLGINTIPASPSAGGGGAAGSTVISADLEIGDASRVGVDRPQHWATNVGASTHTMVSGRQYRIVASVINALYDGSILTCSPGVPRGYSLMNAPQLNLNSAAGSTSLIGSTFNWSPGSCTSTSQGSCGSGGPTMQWNEFCGDPPYKPGAIYTGDWLTFTGPTTPAADISISGTPISGFVGYHWQVHLELQTR